MSALLELRGVSVRIGARRLVEDLSLRVGAGEVWALLGANGAGKTLLLEALAGLRAPAAGEILLAGRPLRAWGPLEAARRRAFLPQSLHDAFSATVLEVAMLGRHPHLGRWSWEGAQERAAALAALAAVDLAAEAGRDVTTLSGGERQRAAIAALLAQDAPLLLLDEPVAHLDLNHQVAVLGHLAGLAAAGRAVVLALHDLNLAARFATHALLYLGDGRMAAGAAEAVMNEADLGAAFRHPVTRAELAGRRWFLPA